MSSFVCNIGLKNYLEAYTMQTRLVEMRQAGAVDRDLFLVTEHPSVYTLGRRGGREFLMVPEKFLAEKGIEVVPIERGGVITYHGPGQLVIYPILHLKQSRLSVADYVHRLEEVMVRLAACADVAAVRDERNNGVWVGNKKLGSVGIAIRRSVSFHGLALNVNPDMEPFGWINPCGLTGVQMTSLAVESGKDVTITDLLTQLPALLESVFERSFVTITEEEVEQIGVKN
jgi:lipoyl(octanoyl) transferase